MINEQTKELVKLIQENPELPLVFMVDGEEIVDPYEYGYTLIEKYRVSVQTIWIYQDRYYNHIIDITEAVEEDLINEEEYENLSNEEFNKAVDCSICSLSKICDSLDKVN